MGRDLKIEDVAYDVAVFYDSLKEDLPRYTVEKGDDGLYFVINEVGEACLFNFKEKDLSNPAAILSAISAEPYLADDELWETEDGLWDAYISAQGYPEVWDCFEASTDLSTGKVSVCLSNDLSPEMKEAIDCATQEYEKFKVEAIKRSEPAYEDGKENEQMPSWLLSAADGIDDDDPFSDSEDLGQKEPSR